MARYRGPGGRRVRIISNSSGIAKTRWAAEGVGLGLSAVRLVEGWAAIRDRMSNNALVSWRYDRTRRGWLAGPILGW